MEELMSCIVKQFKDSPHMISHQLLIDLLHLSLDLKIRQLFTLGQLDVLKSIVCYLIDKICTGGPNDRDVSTLVIVLKLLRNLCAGVKRNQSHIGQVPFIEELKRFIMWNTENSTLYEYGTLVTCLVQLVGNICVTNGNGQASVWHLFHPIVFRCLLSLNSSRVFSTTCMVIFNCIKGTEKERMKSMFVGNTSIIGLILNSLKTWKGSETEWAVLLLEELLLSIPLSTMTTLSQTERISLLEFLLAYSNNCAVSKSLEEGIKEEITSDGISSKAETLFQSVLSSHSNLLYLQGLYTSLVRVTLEEEMSSLTSGQSGEKRETIDQLLIVLRLLCHSSSSHNLLQLLQEFDDSIIHSSIDLLHFLSKLDGSLESARNISHSSSSSSSSSSSPALYGVKRDLVRLIGNLCYQCKRNQDSVHDSIPLILNQCSIDHTNPFIQQWSVWAIRNICKDNVNNQDVIRRLEGGGRVTLTQLEESLDCVAEIDKDGKLKMKKR